MPSHLYELLPIAVLIGTIFVMARLAQSSEYTILRTSGLGPWRALRTLLALGLAFTLLTFAAGDYLAPVADRTAPAAQGPRCEGRISIGQTGAWLKERQPYHTYNVNVKALTPDGDMQDVRIFEADSARLPGVGDAGAQGPLRRRRRLGAAGRRTQRIQHARRRSAGSNGMKLPTMRWPTEITPRDGVGGAAQARPHEHHRPVPVHPPPGGQRRRPRSATRSSSGARCSIRCAAW